MVWREPFRSIVFHSLRAGFTTEMAIKGVSTRVLKKKGLWERFYKYDKERRDAIVAGDVTIDPSSREVTLAGSQVELTAREFDLLEHFARNPGRVFRRADLLDKVWGYGHEGYEHTVNSHINRLRAKIESDPSKPEKIVTIWGVGYKFAGEARA